MPTEHRRMIFTNEEVSNALISYYNMKSEPIPTNNTIVGASIEESDSGAEVHLHHPKLDENSATEKSTILPVNMAAALLVNYCIENKIPLPKKQKKSLTVDGDNLVIMIRSDTKKSVGDPVIPL